MMQSSSWVQNGGVSRRGWTLFIALCVIWGLPYLMIRVAVREVDPGTLVFLRTVPAALLVLPFAIRSGQLRQLRGRLWWLLLYTVVEFGVPWLLMMAAERHLSSSLTALLVAAVPLVAAVVYRFSHVHERYGLRRTLGLLLGALGVIALVGLSVEGSTWSGIAMMGVAVLGYAIGPLIIATRLSDLPGSVVVGLSIAAVALAYGPWGLTHLPAHLSIEAIGAIGVLSIVCTAAGFLCFFALIVEVGPARMTVVTYVNPAVAVLLGSAFLGEALTSGMLLGFPLIILGSVLATSRDGALKAPEGRGRVVSAEAGADGLGGGDHA
jgi:drug/metabolite transporter (DMT)-like permease